MFNKFIKFTTLNIKKMMKKYFVILVLISLIQISCDKQENKTENSENGYELTGKVENFSDGSVVILNQLIGQNLVKKDSAIIENGEFIFKGTVPLADFYQMVFDNGLFMVFILDNKKLEFVADKSNFEGSKKINGSTDTDVLVAMTNEINNRNVIRQNLNMKVMEAQQNGDEEAMQRITKEFEASEQQSIERLKKVIAANTHSFIAAIGALNFIDPATDFEFLEKISKELNEKVPDSRYTKDLFMKINSMRVVSVGAMAPDITLPNPNGQNQSLSELKGKYVLIDFWASWCRPCRMENPNVVKLYDKYKGPNFEIFGVSLDQDGTKWKDAIQKDNISWWQVSDLQGWQSSAAAKYNVTSIPSTFLIDPDGKIIAKNLRGAALEEKIKEILG